MAPLLQDDSPTYAHRPIQMQIELRRVIPENLLLPLLRLMLLLYGQLEGALVVCSHVALTWAL